MADPRGKRPQELSDELRAAVERTFDEAVRRGKDVRGAVENELEALRKRVSELESSLSKRIPRDRG